MCHDFAANFHEIIFHAIAGEHSGHFIATMSLGYCAEVNLYAIVVFVYAVVAVDAHLVESYKLHHAVDLGIVGKWRIVVLCSP